MGPSSPGCLTQVEGRTPGLTCWHRAVAPELPRPNTPARTGLLEPSFPHSPSRDGKRRRERRRERASWRGARSAALGLLERALVRQVGVGHRAWTRRGGKGSFFETPPQYRSPVEVSGEETEAQRRQLARGRTGSQWEPRTPICAGCHPQDTRLAWCGVNFMCQHDSVTGCPGMASTRLQVCLQAVPSGIRTRMGGLSGAIALPRGWAPPSPGEGRRTRPLCRLPALDIRLLPLGWDSHRQLSWSPACRWQTVGRPSL